MLLLEDGFILFNASGISPSITIIEFLFNAGFLNSPLKISLLSILSNSLLFSSDILSNLDSKFSVVSLLLPLDSRAFSITASCAVKLIISLFSEAVALVAVVSAVSKVFINSSVSKFICSLIFFESNPGWSAFACDNKFSTVLLILFIFFNSLFFKYKYCAPGIVAKVADVGNDAEASIAPCLTALVKFSSFPFAQSSTKLSEDPCTNSVLGSTTTAFIAFFPSCLFTPGSILMPCFVAAEIVLLTEPRLPFNILLNWNESAKPIAPTIPDAAAARPLLTPSFLRS